MSALKSGLIWPFALLLLVEGVFCFSTQRNEGDFVMHGKPNVLIPETHLPMQQNQQPLDPINLLSPRFFMLQPTYSKYPWHLLVSKTWVPLPIANPWMPHLMSRVARPSFQPEQQIPVRPPGTPPPPPAFIPSHRTVVSPNPQGKRNAVTLCSAQYNHLFSSPAR